MKIGYARVSTFEQNRGLQLQALAILMLLFCSVAPQHPMIRPKATIENTDAWLAS